MILIGLCGCKGRTASTPEANGDTVEVVINTGDNSVDPDSLYSIKDEMPEAEDDESANGHDISPMEAAGQSVKTPDGAKQRVSAGSVSVEKAL